MLLSILPSLHVIRSWGGCLVEPLYITLEDQPALSKLTVPTVATSTIASVNTTSSNNQICWKALTVIIDPSEDMSGELPNLNRPLSHLKYFTLIFNGNTQSTILSSLSTLKEWSLPSLTHLSLHLYSNEHRGAVKDVLRAFGRQIEFFALTGECNMRGTDRPWFCELLTAALNIKEFVFDPQPSDNIDFDQLPPAKYANVEIVGLPVSIQSPEMQSLKNFSWYIQLCVRAFPSLRIFRITGTLALPSREHMSKLYNSFWVREAAIDLRSKGIRLEDRRGRDLWELLGEAADEMEDELEDAVFRSE